MGVENEKIDWHDFTIDGPIPDRHTVVSKWLPLIDESGKPVQLKPNVEGTIFARLTGKHAKSLVTVTASVTEMHQEVEANAWLPKIGAAHVCSTEVCVYAPYGQIRMTASLAYSRPISIGVMLHLGFGG